MFTSGYRPKATNKTPGSPPNADTAAIKTTPSGPRLNDCFYNVQTDKTYIYDGKNWCEFDMATSVRLDNDMFVVRINGCQHKLSKQDAVDLTDRLGKMLGLEIYWPLELAD